MLAGKEAAGPELAGDGLLLLPVRRNSIAPPTRVRTRIAARDGGDVQRLAGGLLIEPVRRKQRQLPLGTGEDDAPREAEGVDDRVEQGARDAGRVGGALEGLGEVGECLEVVPPTAQLTLVDRGERGGRDGDQPQDDDEDGEPGLRAAEDAGELGRLSRGEPPTRLQLTVVDGEQEQ